MDATVLIATYNRAALLDETLDLAGADARCPRPSRWEAMIIDNNSTDDTRAVVERHVAGSSPCGSATSSKGSKDGRARSMPGSPERKGRCSRSPTTTSA